MLISFLQVFLKCVFLSSLPVIIENVSTLTQFTPSFTETGCWVPISATAEAHWGRLFYHTDMRITLRCNCQAAPPPRQLRVDWRKTRRENEKKVAIDRLNWNCDKNPAQDLEGHNHKETHHCKWKTPQSFSLTFPWLLLVSLSCTAAIRRVLMCFPPGFEKPHVFRGAFLF